MASGDHDPRGLSGLGHTIEHVYLTAAAGDHKARTAEELSRQHPDGANGQTGDRYTVVATTFPLEDLDRELADAAARMAGPRVTEDDLDRERPRLLQEVENMFDGFPTLAAMNNARELVRPSPAGGRHGGRTEQVRAIGLRDIQARLDRYYKPRNATIALAGDFDPPAVLKSIARHFDTIPAGAAVPPPGNPGTPRFFVPVRPKSGQADMAQGEPTACLADPAPAPDRPEYPAFLILMTRLWAAGDRLGGAGVTGSPVDFTPLDDGSVVAISASLKGGETPARAGVRADRKICRRCDRAEARAERGRRGEGAARDVPGPRRDFRRTAGQ
ncbi:MAG: M16 family metallopeptidase [Isosphaeraceae bacterium]